MSVLLPVVLSVAFAQDETPAYGFDAHGFRFVTGDADPRDPARFYRPGATEPLAWSVGAVAEYANRPLVFESRGLRRIESAGLAAVNIAAGIAPISALRVDVSVPVILTNAYAPGPVELVLEGGGPTLGDLRASVLGTAMQPTAELPFGLGLVAALDLPTGAPERWLGTRGPAALVAAVATAELDRLTASGQVGARVAPNTQPDERPAPTMGGDTFEVAGGVGYLLDAGTGIGLELQSAIPIDAAVRTALGIPLEATFTGRYVGGSGAYVAGGVGFGLGEGAGASPVRLVVGGGFGTAVVSTPKDTDGDGFADKLEACPGEPETANLYRDEDGCPDGLPRVVFQARLGAEDAPEATLKMTGPDGRVLDGVGRGAIEGLPGEVWTVEAHLGACRAGVHEATVPMEGEVVDEVPLTRSEGTVLVTVTDTSGRPLEGQVRYIVEEEVCRPADASLKLGRGTHVVGTGPTKVFVTAMGYDVYQETFTLAAGEQKLVEAKLKPTSVSLRDGKVKTNAAVTFAAGTATLEERSGATVEQVASLLLSLTPVPAIEIGAWADGKDAKKLSQQRADAVKERLVSVGVPPELLTAVGKGALPKDQKEVVSLVVVP